MVRFRPFFFAILCMLMLWIAAASNPVYAQQTYPFRNDPVINDLAGVLDARDARRIREIASAVQEQYGADLTVLTIQRISDYSVPAVSLERFATDLFNQWGIGNSRTNLGILVLLAVDDRAVRIELGSGYNTSYNDLMQDVIDTDMLPSFREEEYSTGIVDGIRGIQQALAGQVDTNGGDWSAAPVRTSNPPVWLWWALGGGGTAGAGALGWAGFRRYQRNRPRTCPTCGMPMVRLDHLQDDAHLNAGQNREESLGSVEYDVWVCQACHNSTTETYPAMFTSYAPCPRCGFKTLGSSTRTVRNATYTSTGERLVTRLCENCAFTDARTETIPRRTRSTSSGRSGGGSSGGGRSSGGGASGRW